MPFPPIPAALALLASLARVPKAPNVPDGAPATLAGVVTDADGQPVAHAHAAVGERAALTGRDGAFTLRDLPAGAVEVSVRAIGYESEARSVVLADGRVTHLVVRLRRAAATLSSVVVLSGTATRDVLGTRDVVVLGGDRLRVGATSSIGKTLERVPGVANLSGGPAAGNAVLRGMSQGRIRIARDGVAQESFDASPRWFPPSDLASVGAIQVVRGPASVLYGSSALGGAIDLVPRPLPASADGAARVEGLAESQYFTNNGERYGHLMLAGAAGPLGVRVGGSRRVADGFRTADVPPYDVTRRRGDPRYTGRIPYSNFAQSAGYAQLGLTGSAGEVQASGDAWRGANNFPNANGKPAGVLSENATARLKGVLNAGAGRVQSSLGVQRVRIRRAATAARTYAAAADGDLWDQDLVSRVTTGRVAYEHPAVAGVRGSLGAELQDQRAETLRSRIQPSGRTSDAALFGYEEYRRERLSLSGGLRVDVRRQRADSNGLVARLPTEGRAAALDRRFHVVTGSLGGAYRLWRPLSAAVTLSTGFRAPSAVDLYTDENRPSLGGWVEGNPRLRPERSTSVETSLRLTTSRVSGAATVYRNRFSDFVYLARSDRTHAVGATTLPVFATLQAPARIVGGELSAAVHPVSALFVDASWSALRSRNLARGEPLPLMPADNARATVRLMPARLRGVAEPYVELGVKHAWAKRRAGPTEPFAEFDDNPAGYGVSSTPAYTLLDAGVGGRVVTGPTAVTVHVAVENLRDTPYRDFLDTQKGFTLGQGRNVTLRVSVPFAVR
jgi:iron complex outermembrane receptor protein/hemoglobin/transferrin/lactoferrin receptor protein